MGYELNHLYYLPLGKIINKNYEESSISFEKYYNFFIHFIRYF